MAEHGLLQHYEHGVIVMCCPDSIMDKGYHNVV